MNWSCVNLGFDGGIELGNVLRLISRRRIFFFFNSGYFRGSELWTAFGTC